MIFKKINNKTRHILLNFVDLYNSLDESIKEKFKTISKDTKVIKILFDNINDIEKIYFFNINGFNKLIAFISDKQKLKSKIETYNNENKTNQITSDFEKNASFYKLDFSNFSNNQESIIICIYTNINTYKIEFDKEFTSEIYQSLINKKIDGILYKIFKSLLFIFKCYIDYINQPKILKGGSSLIKISKKPYQLYIYNNKYIFKYKKYICR